MSVPNQGYAQGRWQWSMALNSWFFYDKTQDVIVLEDGLRLPRPATLSRDSLTHAFMTKEGPDIESRPQQASDSDLDSSPARQRNAPAKDSPRSVGRDVSGFSIPQSTPRALRTAFSRLDLGSSSAMKQPIEVSRQSEKSRPSRRVSSEVASSTIRGPRSWEDDASTSRLSMIGDTGRLHTSYREPQDPRSFFVSGRIFLTLWAETIKDGQRTDAVVGKFGEQIHQKVRRFVVIREGEHYCSVLPIMTYGGRGVAKNNVVKSEHAVIFTGMRAPPTLPNENADHGKAGMLAPPIHVIPDSAVDKLDPMSRLDFGKVYTVEHNVKVRSLGVVDHDSKEILKQHFRTIWLLDLYVTPSTSQSSSSVTRSSPTAESELRGGARDRGTYMYRAMLQRGHSPEMAMKLVSEYLQRV